jgi:hypothetical protein
MIIFFVVWQQLGLQQYYASTQHNQTGLGLFDQMGDKIKTSVCYISLPQYFSAYRKLPQLTSL